MARRTAVGLDVGTTDVIAANVGRKGVDIVQNAVSERRTPVLVSFTSRRRLLGDAAAPQLKSNYRNSCRGLKHVIGRALDSPDIQAEKLWALCGFGRADSGDVGYEITYRDKPLCLSATICLSMLVTSIVATCKAWTKMDVREVVYAIPSYYTEHMRQACLDALRIAGVQCLRLLHESTALAIAWRFERTNFEDATPVVVALCSAGHSGLCVAVARYEKGAISILGEAYDRSVSGRGMDRVLIEMFAKSLQKQGAPDPLTSVKSLLKMEEAATKVKKTISVVDEARAVAECVVDDFDLNCDVKRDAFEEACAGMVARAKDCVVRALAAAQVTVEELAQVEVVGGCSRIPFVQRALREAFGRELSTSLNADEAVAKGCAWAAAMLSPSVRMSPIPLKESGTPAIALEWKDSEAVEVEGAVAVDGGRRRLLVFEAHAGPGAEAEVNIRCKGTLELSAVQLVQEGEEPAPLGSWKLEFPGKALQEVEIQCGIDLNGLFAVTKASICTGKEQAEAEAKAAAEAKAREEEAKAKADAEGAARRQAEEEARTKTTPEAKEEGDGQAEGGTAQGSDAAEGQAAATEGEAAAGLEGEAAAVGEAQPEAAAKAEGEAASSPEPSPEASPAESGSNAATAGEPEASPAVSSAQEKCKEAAGEEEPLEMDMGSAGADVGSAEGKSGGFNWRFWQWGRGKKDQDVEAPAASAPQQKRKVGGGKAITVVKRQPVQVLTLTPLGFDKDTMAQAVRAELQYRSTDAEVVLAEKSRNDFESYIFELRNKLSSGTPLLTEYASPEERERLGPELDEAETWSYDHTDEESSVYADRLKKLQALEKECRNRQATLDEVDTKVKLLRSSIKRYKAAANVPMYNHIAKEKLDSITSECDSNSEWLADLEARQTAVKKWEAPVLSIAELTIRNSSLTTAATKTLSEPKPKPPEPPKEEKDAKGGKDGKDGKKKGKKEKGDAKDEGEDAATEKAAEAEAEAEVVAKAASASEAAKRKRKRWLMGGAAVAAALLLAALAAGLGEPLGVPSPLAPWLGLGGGGGGDDFEEVAGEEPGEEADEAPEPAAAGSEDEL